jgi:hypothetical protein
MEELFQKAKSFVRDHKKQFSIGVPIVVVILVSLLIWSLYAYNHQQPKIVYEPANACDLMTMAEAKTLLGDKTINGVNITPEQQGDITISKCSYSDGLPDVSNAVVAAIIVRSGINDPGIALNKAQFISGKPSSHVQDVSGLGDIAYFNQINGQLNVLKDSTWIVVSYGSGSDSTTNTVDNDTKLAKLALNVNAQ